MQLLFFVDLLKLEGVTVTESELAMPKKKVHGEDVSNYVKLSMDGGHKGYFSLLLQYFSSYEGHYIMYFRIYLHYY